MTWAVLYRPAALRDLRKLPREVQAAIHAAAEALGEDQHPAGCRKMTGAERRWRVRVGDYRLVYEVEEAAQSVLVVAVGHRREVYR